MPLGPEATVERARHNIRSYYDLTSRAASVADRLLTTPDDPGRRGRLHRRRRADEVVLYGLSSAPTRTPTRAWTG